jgi:hypothetical protein
MKMALETSFISGEVERHSMSGKDELFLYRLLAYFPDLNNKIKAGLGDHLAVYESVSVTPLYLLNA